MKSAIAATILVLFAPFTARLQEQKLTAPVTIQPACPKEPPRPASTADRQTVPVRIRYDTAAASAKLNAPESLTIDLVINSASFANGHRTYPMSRTGDGAWEVTIQLEPYWSFLIFMVKDQAGRIDNNGGNYWEIIGCGADGTPTGSATFYQAESHIGNVLAPGIQRPVDYARAISIVEDDLRRHPDRIESTARIWAYQIKQEGSSDAAYTKLSVEIERFVSEQKSNEKALAAAVRFVSSSRRKFPATLLDSAKTALLRVNPNSPMLGELLWSDIRAEKDARRRVSLYREFVQTYPHDDYTQSAYAQLFETLAFEIKDAAAAEQAFEDWRRLEPLVADVPASMGRFYVDQRTKPQRAVELLNRAIDLCQNEVKDPLPRSGILRRLMVMCNRPDPGNPAPGEAQLEREFAQLRFYRGQAYAQLGNLKAAIQDAEFAARVLNESTKVALRLGEIYEKAGRKKAAFAAYLDAATAPQQANRDPMTALERLFLRGKMGTRADLEARILARTNERRLKVAAEFKPVPLDRPAPVFEFTTFDGKKLDNSALRGRLVVLNFWAEWCGPCRAEMPAFLELQRRNPGVMVIGVAVLSESSTVETIIRERKWGALMMAHSEAAGTKFGVTSVPQTFVLDEEGHIRFVHASGLADVVAMLEKELTLLKK